MNKFFLVCPIGLEYLLENEIEVKYPHFFNSESLLSITKAQGGIEIECPMENGLRLNQIIRSCSKILLRIKRQKCRDLPKLYNIIRKINWKTYFNQEHINFNITAKKSRLIHTKRIEDSATNALVDYFNANKIKASIKEKFADAPIQTLFLRFFDDELTISLDTSGDLLHIRGDRSFRGHASLRENIAHLLLLKLFENLDQGKAYNLIDPMCGTGTFLQEALKFNAPNERDFNYNYLNIAPLEPLQVTQAIKSLDLKLFGLDIDSEIIENNRVRTDIHFEQQDLFHPKQLEGNNLVIMNPPYGKRIQISGDKKKFFLDICFKVSQAYDPIKFAMIIPRDFVPKIPCEKLYFKQNGIDVCFIIISKNKMTKF